MKKEVYDYMTSQEKKSMDKSVQRVMEIVKEIKKLEAERSRNVRKVMRLTDAAEQRMKDAESQEA